MATTPSGPGPPWTEENISSRLVHGEAWSENGLGTDCGARLRAGSARSPTELMGFEIEYLFEGFPPAGLNPWLAFSVSFALAWTTAAAWLARGKDSTDDLANAVVDPLGPDWGRGQVVVTDPSESPPLRR